MCVSVFQDFVYLDALFSIIFKRRGWSAAIANVVARRCGRILRGAYVTGDMAFRGGHACIVDFF